MIVLCADGLWRDVGQELRVRYERPTEADQRDAVLEEAANLCNVASNQPSSLWEEQGCWAHAAEYCAAQIRALKRQSAPLERK